jgi:hypothetical protein
MIYVQFYKPNLIGEMDWVLGDRGVVVLDGRESRATHRRIAQRECTARGYKAWRLFRGPSFTRSNPISTITLAE